jgi:hypothetical protein
MGDALSAIDLGTGVQVLGISGGGHHTSVILDDGSVKAFGLNDYGQLGKENTRRLGNAANEMGSNLTAIDLGTGLDAATTSLSITIDLVAPTVTFTPVNGTANVSSSASVLIAFNEPVRNTDNSALSDDNIDALITLKDTDASGSDIAFDATINSTKTLITIVPNSYFSSLQNVYVAIGATVEDFFDNAISTSSVTFTTADSTAPTIVFDPEDLESPVPVTDNITLTFNEAIQNIDDIGITLSSYKESMNKDSSQFSKYAIPELDCIFTEEWDYTFILWHKNNGAVEALKPLITKAGLYHFHD